ncbi:MAG: DNA-processing protein DprA [Candidatus Babeliaceae bacterium]|nr:DNA-processing protein DprA [Candidatus Babeliaceae bacterium]
MHQVIASHVVLHISLIDGVGPKACATLCEVFADNLHELYLLDLFDLQRRTGLSQAVCQKICAGLADKAILDKEMALIQKHAIFFVTLLDPEYPQLLRQIHAPPTVLYYKSDSPLQLSPALAFVGSRKADNYGQQVTQHIIPEIVKEGFITISGGALGIDGMVHRETVKAGGRTVAILGSGLLKPYPHAHKGLFDQIVYSGGFVMSSFPLEFEPLPQNFPARNRIIAGMSLATIVIQAAIKSGALLTARNALDEGRDVGVVPGSIFNELSTGCHELITQGARAITKTEDIFELIGYQAKTSRVPVVKAPSACPSKPIQTVSPDKRRKDSLLTLCITPKSTDYLLAQAGLSFDKLQERLWQLQIEGQLEQNILGQWKAVDR